MTSFWIRVLMPQLWPHGIKIVHDVYIVWKWWKIDQGQGPAIDWCFVYRWSRLVPMVYRASQAQHILEYNVNTQFNKIPQLAMHCNIRDGGIISQGIGWGVVQTPEPIGWDLMSMREPISSHIPFLFFVLDHWIILEGGWGS